MLSELLQNQMFIQALAGMGQALDPKGVGGALGGVANQMIQAKNYQNSYNKMLAQLLGPDGSKGTFDSSGLTLKIPPNDPMISKLLGGQSNPGGTSLISPEIINSLNPSGQNPDAGLPTPQITSGGRPTLANPFVGSDQYGMTNLSTSDLAGMSPEMIASAFGLAQNAKQLHDKSYNDVIDSMYKNALIRQIDANIENMPEEQKIAWAKIQKEAAQDQPAPIAGPGGQVITLREFQAFPEKERSYLIAKHGAALLGDDKFMSQREWEETAPTEQGRFIKAIMKDPRMKKTAMELRKAGATNISLGTKLAEKKAMGTLEGQLYFSDPKWTEDLSKQINSEDVQNKLFTSKNPALERAKETVKFVEAKITGGGGMIEDVKKSSDGRTMIWTVRWPSGDVNEVRSVIK